MVLGLEMIRPQNVEVDQDTLTNTFGKFLIQPLERGYGSTIGNSLRRVLLSSLSGAAITGVRVDGALHEFSALPDVREDLTELILNLKQVRIKMHGKGPEEIELEVKGEGVATAGDFEGSSNIEVLNPQLVLAHIGKGGVLKITAIVEQGRDFRSSEENKNADWPLGTIAIDSIFSPVIKVNFDVSNARVGQRTDYDKLVMEVHTDGSVKPLDSISIAANLLQDQLSIFGSVSLSEHGSQAEQTAGEAVGGSLNPLFRQPIQDLNLQNRSVNSLLADGIMFVGDLVRLSEDELMRVKNLGKKSQQEIISCLESLGLSLGMEIEGWPPAELTEKSS